MALQLCERWESSGYGAAQCQILFGGCEGASSGFSGAIGACFPYIVWSDSFVGSQQYHRALHFTNGSFESQGVCHQDSSAGGEHGKCAVSWSFSVRCLLLARYPATCGAGGHRVRSHPYRPRLRCAVSWI